MADGAAKGSPGPAGGRGIFRNEYSGVITGFSSRFSVCNFFKAEILAIAGGLEIARSLGIRNLMVQIDNLACVQILKNEVDREDTSFTLALKNPIFSFDFLAGSICVFFFGFITFSTIPAVYPKTSPSSGFKFCFPMLKKYCCCIPDDQEQQDINAQSGKSRDYPWEIYTLRELVHATNNFHNDNKIGEGGFGSVYWGRTSKGVEIAIKRLKAMSAKAEMEFAVEVEILGRVRHKNLLGLRGFYAGGDERLIVYDYMPNHSLITHLHGQLASDCLLDWPRRIGVAIGSAEGISYLHQEANPHIIHRDIKAKKLAGGVKRDIVQWATPLVQKGAYEQVVDPRLKGKYDRAQLKSLVIIAMRCTDSNPENRPSMIDVVEMLKGGNVGSRRKEITIVKDMADGNEDEDFGDEDTDYEGQFGNGKPAPRLVKGGSRRRRK
ncbi:Protein kinase domain-containing protein [Heracleum sosnowskyi]|uniref:non-specific serine/threonine protein kinase n=1 Tax=Heracleum sosnowskyi TaxID=360622 RepID=A0AAD8HGD7_9APIA|nr:Protein kinase domain-containing protein [Heracleum sosnowskyi]